MQGNDKKTYASFPQILQFIIVGSYINCWIIILVVNRKIFTAPPISLWIRHSLGDLSSSTPALALLLLLFPSALRLFFLWLIFVVLFFFLLSRISAGFRIQMWSRGLA